MSVSLTRAVSVAVTLLPIMVSLVRDWRRFIFFGEGRILDEEQHRERAVYIRETMGKLGPTFIKGAQVLAMREDMVPPVYARELRKLQDQVPPFPSETAAQIIRNNFGKKVSAIFDEFDHDPIAAASLGQVHKAVYKGKPVAVKVLRPGVQKLVETDLRVVMALLYILKLGVDDNLMRSFLAIISEYRRMIRQEMDFKNEKTNADRIRRNFRNNPEVVIPRFYGELTTSQVAVLEFIDGIRVDDAQALSKMNLSSDKIIDMLIRAYVRMVVVHGYIHADPHPGNLMIDKKGRLVILDHGMALEFSESTRTELLKLVYAVTKRDAGAIVDGYYNLGMVDAEINRGVLRDAAQTLLDIQLDDDVTVRQMQEIAQQILDTFYKFPLRLPNNLVYLMRASTLVEGIALTYDERFNAIKTATPIVKELLTEIAFDSDKSIADRVQELAKEGALTLKELVGLIHRMDRENFKVRIHEADLIEVERVMTSLVRRFLLGAVMCTAAVIVTLSPAKNPIFLFIVLAILFIVVLALVLAPVPRGPRGPYFK